MPKIDPFATVTVAEEPTEAIPAVLKHRPTTSIRNRSWERAQRDKGTTVTYRGIPGEINAEIKRIAEELHVPVSEIARALLEAGLEDYRAGRLTLDPQFTGKLSLFASSSAG